MSEELVSIGIAYDTSQLLTGTRQVQDALRQVEQAEKSAGAATRALEESSTQAAQAMVQERAAASGAASTAQQLAQASGQAASALQQTASAASQAAQTLRQTEQAAGAVGRQVGGISSALGTFGQQVGAFGLAQAGVLGLQQALSTLQTTFTDVVRTGLQLAQLRSSFTAIAGGIGAGNREFQFAVKTANELGLEVRAVAEQYRSLSAATRGTNLEGAATRELFTTLARAAQAYGLSTEQLGRAMTAFQQIISKGKVSMEELRGQLSEAIPGAMQIAARAYGTNTAALEDMIGKGVEASEFVRKFTAQLGTETPQAAARAGKGIAQLGNEILLLKDRIAQSGLIAFLDSAASKLATLLRQGREAEEQAGQRAERRAGRELGGGVTLDSMQAQDRQKLIDTTRELADAEKRLSDLTKAREERKFGVFTALEIPESTLRAARQQVDTLREEERALKTRLNLQTLETQEQAKRRDSMNRGFKEQQSQTEAVDSANKSLKTQVDAVKKSTDDLNKSSALTPEIYGKINGTLQEQIRFYEQRKKITEAGLKDVTETIVARSAGTGAVPKELEAQKSALQERLRDDNAAIERNKQAIEDLEKAKRKALQDTEEAQRKAKQAREEEARLDQQQAEEVARTHFQNIEALRRLEAQYTSVKAARDEDRASLLAASLATSQYADEAKRLATAIEDVQRVEAQLPALRSQAASSAQRLTDIQRLEQQLEPRRRGQTLAEQHAATLAELERVTPLEQREEVLGTARAKSQDTLAIAQRQEEFQQMEAFAVSTLDHIGDAMTQLAMHGKFTFKDMTMAIAEDFYRMSVQTALSMARQVDWLKVGSQVLGAVTGVFGATPTSGTLPTSWGAYGQMSAAGAFSGRQGGGPVSGGTPYMVGESGPELFVPRTSGVIVPHGSSMSSGPVVVNMTVNTNDAGSFTRSRGEIEATMYTAMQRAMRNA